MRLKLAALSSAKLCESVLEPQSMIVQIVQDRHCGEFITANTSTVDTA